MSALQTMNALTDKQRMNALDAARRRIAGAEPSIESEPQLEQYERKTYTKYPPALIAQMRRLGYVILGAAFFASSIRIFLAAFEMSAISIPAFQIAIAIGLASVLLAESGQVAFTLWAATTDGLVLRVALWIGALGCTAFALIANAQVVQPWMHQNALAWVETFLPPVLVLIASHVLKSQALHAIENRHTAQMRFEEDHDAWAERIKSERKVWQDAYDNAHLSPRWMHIAANAIRDALIGANSNKSRIQRELTDADWRALVMREMSAEDWYERAEQQEAQAKAEQERIATEMRLRAEREQAERTEERSRKIALRSQSVGASSGVPTGETHGAVHPNANGTFTAECPYCHEQFIRDTLKGATNALPGHFRKCVVRKAQLALNSATVEGLEQVVAMATNGHSKEEIPNG